MRKAALVDHFWLAGVSTGWNGTRDFYNHPPANWNLFQNALEVSVDTNLVNPSAGGLLGAFNGAGLIGSLDDSAVRTNLRFIKANEPALFFKAPDGAPIIHVVEWDDNHGQHHSVSRNFIEARRMVSDLDAGPDWSKVESHSALARSIKGTFVPACLRQSIGYLDFDKRHGKVDMASSLRLELAVSLMGRDDDVLRAAVAAMRIA
jgi:hypothetical protein